MHKRPKVPTKNDVSQVLSHLTQNGAAIVRVRARICGGAEADPFPLESEAIRDTTKRADLVVRNISWIPVNSPTTSVGNSPAKAETFWQLKHFNTFAWKRFSFLIEKLHWFFLNLLNFYFKRSSKYTFENIQNKINCFFRSQVLFKNLFLSITNKFFFSSVVISIALIKTFILDDSIRSCSRVLPILCWWFTVVCKASEGDPWNDYK